MFLLFALLIKYALINSLIISYTKWIHFSNFTLCFLFNPIITQILNVFSFSDLAGI